MSDEICITYDKNSEFAGHQHNENVNIVQAAEEIFKEVKENAMQLTVAGEFMEFDSLDSLKPILLRAHEEGGRIWLCDENIGG